MKQIESKGNLPKVFQIFLKEMGSEIPAEVYECESSKELMSAIKDDQCEEAQVAQDMATGRKYMTAFGFTKSNLVNIGGNSFVTLKIYFTELSDIEFKRWRKELDKHRRQQEDDMNKRRQRR